MPNLCANLLFFELIVFLGRGLPLVVVSMILAIGLSGPLTAQSLSGPLAAYHVRTFTPADGLPAADARYVTQLPDDHIYVTTARGVVRFDGYAFHPVPLPGFESRVIESAHADRAGRLWLLTKENELGYVADGRFHRLPRVEALRNSINNPLFETADDVLWIGGPNGLVRVTPNAETPYTHFTADDGLPSVVGLRVLDAPNGHRLVVTHEGMAFIIPDATTPHGIRFVPFVPAGAPPSTEQHYTVWSSTEGIWLIFDDHVRRYEGLPRSSTPIRPVHLEASERTPILDLEALGLPDGQAAHFEPAVSGRLRFPDGSASCATHRPQNELSCRVLPTGDGTYWLTYSDTVVQIEGGRVASIAPAEQLNIQRINAFALDHEGSLWLGTNRGVVQLVPRRVTPVTTRAGLAEPFTTSVLQTRDGALWVGTWGGGLHRFTDDRLTRRYTAADGLPHDKVRALYETRDGTLWVGTLQGVTTLRNDRFISRLTAIGEVRAFAEAPDGTLWTGTSMQLVAHRPDGHTLWPDSTFWLHKEIWALHAARDGSLWIGSENGLFRYTDGRLHTYGPADGLQSPFVVAIHEEDDGTLWFSTYEDGLHRYRNGRFVAVTTHEGLHHNGIWRMLEDARGGVWMSSDQGIFRVERARLHAVADALQHGHTPTAPLNPLVFTEAEGLPSRECNRAGPAGWRLSDGRLAFNNLRGLVLIDPERALTPPPPPHTTLHRIVADGTTVDAEPSGTVTVPAGTKQLRVDFAALSFVAPGQNYYRYRLVGYDDTWIDSDRRSTASYTNLSPDDYVFEVQSASGLSAWGRSTSVALTLRPLLWQTWWFRLLALGLVTGLLAAAYQYRVHRLLEMERLRLRLASDLHDDVGSNISSIALISEMLQNQAGRDEVEQRHLQRIHLAAEETVHALRDIIWLVNPQHDTLADLVRKMQRVRHTLLNGTACTFEVDTPVAPYPMSMNQMRNIFLIYKEALHNITKHAEAQHVNITIAEDGGWFTLRIRDDGVGFAESDIVRGLGLANMRRRARTMDGSIEIKSTPGVGTQITFSAKMA